MTITSIRPYEKGKNRVAIYLNDEFAFVLYKGELSKYKLVENMELADETYDRILNETLYKRARLRGMNLLQKMDRTEKDIRNKLREGGYPAEVIDNAIEYLKSYHYIDDERYAAEFIRFKSTSNSRREIVRKLKEKGVSESIIEHQYMEFDDDNDNGNNSDAEIELIKKLMIKKCKNFGTLDYESKMKLYAYLYRKGFTQDAIEKAYKDLT